ncbi:MAG: HAMP domain-containing protein, partial [Bacillota bacterium]
MKRFNDLKISTKVLAGQVIAAVFTIIAGVLGLYSIIVLGVIFSIGLGIMISREAGILSASIAKITEDIREKTAAVQKIVQGDLTFHVKLQSNKDLLGIGINDLIDLLNNLTAESNACAAAASDGALTESIILSSENDNINACIDSITSLVEDTEMLSVQVMQGNLNFRIDGERHAGDFARIVNSFNRALDSVIQPLNVASSHIRQIGEGEIPQKITEEYQGEFNQLKNNINSCIDGLGGLVEGKIALERMRSNDFSAKVEGNYQGIFAGIAESINMISDQILHIIDILCEISDGNLNELAQLKSTGKKCANDTLLPAIVTMMENIKDLEDETHDLSVSAVQGKLSARGNVERFKGVYANIIEGTNQTLDAVTNSAYEVIEVLKEVANGNLQASVKGNYVGDHAAIKNAINETVENIRGYIYEISSVLSGISSGNLDIEITMEHKGDFVEIGDSLKNIINTLNQTMGDFGNAAEQVSSGSRQVSEGSQTLAQGSTEQASSIQELTASISAIAEQSRDNA